jgi:protein-tyrosine-phosphatase
MPAAREHERLSELGESVANSSTLRRRSLPSWPRSYNPRRTEGPCQGDSNRDVPDPYYAGPDGFEVAYQMIERSARRLLETLRA